MKYFMKIFVLFFYLSGVALAMLPPKAVNSGMANKGNLHGRIIDSKTGEGLPGANILLQATTVGTVSDLEGYFNLENIPSGRYTLLISILGYKPGVYEKITIAANQTTELQAELESTLISAPEVIVTASKSSQRVQDSPISVAVLSDLDIRQKNSITIQDALRFTPGLYMTDDQVNIRGSTGYNKGAGSRVLVLLDGVPAIAGDTGGINWDALPPTEIAQIEVVKGAGSALYGSNALGGVINLITRDPSPQPITRSRLSWGFFDQPAYPSWQFTNRLLQFNAIDVSHSRQIGKLGMLLAVGRKSSTGYRQNGEDLVLNTFNKFTYRYSALSHFTLMINWTFNKHGNLLTWKGPATNHPLEISPESIGDKIHSGKFIVHLTYKTLLRNNLALISKSSVYRNRWQDYFHDNQDYARTYKLQQELQLEYQLSAKHAMTGGVEGIYHTTQSSLFGNPYTYDLALYVQDEFRWSPLLRLTLGARYDRHQVRQLFSEDQLSPKMGLVCQPTPLTAIRLAVGKGFRAASIAEIFTHTLVSGFEVIPNLNLRAESAWSYELGLHQLFGSHFIIDASYFQNDYRNMIEPKLASIIPPAFQLNNLSRARIRGFEVSSRANFWRQHFAFDLSYTYLHAKKIGEIEPIFTLDDPFYQPTDALAYRPKHLIQATLSGRYRWLLLGLDYRYISRFEEVLVYTKDDRVDQRILDGFIKINLSARIQLQVRANNLLNYNYVEVERNLGKIRNFTFTLNYR